MESEVKILFLDEKKRTAENISEFFFMLVIMSSWARIFSGLIHYSFKAYQFSLSIVVLSVCMPLYYATKKSKNARIWIAFILVWSFEPIAQYYAFWLYLKYDVLYAMANTVQLFFCLVEMCLSFRSGIISITVHMILWSTTAYFSGNCPIPSDMETWFALICFYIFHILLFKDRYDKQIESITNKVKLQKKEAQIHSLVQTMPEGILVVNFTKDVLLTNEAYKTFVKDFDQMKYKNKLHTQTDASVKYLNEDLQNFIKSTEKKIVFGTVVENECVLEVTATKILWDSENAVILTFRDVTRVIEMEKKIAEDRSVLETLRGVSHELKTPLHVIINKIREVSNKSKDYEEELNISIQMAKFLLCNIKNIIDYSSIKFKTYQTQQLKVNIFATIKKCINICKTYHFPSILHVYTNISSDFPDLIYLDKSRFKQILVSLINKAAG